MLLDLFTRPIPVAPPPSPEKQAQRDAKDRLIEAGIARNDTQRARTVRELTRYGETMVQAIEIMKG